MVSPIIDEIADEVDSIKVGKIDVDKERELAASFNVLSIPTIMVFKDGKVVNKAVGAKSKSALLSMINV